MGVTTPCAGEIAKIDAEVKGTYAVGAVLGYVEASEADAARFQKRAPQPPKGEVAEEVPGREEERRKQDRTEAARTSKWTKPACRRSPPVRISKSIKPACCRFRSGAKGAGYLSPRVRARMAELQLTQADLAGIAGSGNAGRVTIKDLENFLGGIERQPAEKPSAIRTGVADAMRRSWTRPLATVGVSVCLDPVLQDRAKRDPKPGPALYVLRALALALAEAAERGRASDWRPRDSIGVDRHRRRGGSAGRHHGSGHSQRRQNFARGPNESLHRAGRSGAPSPADRRNDFGRDRVGFEFRHFGLDWGTPIPLPDQTMLLGLGAGKKVPSLGRSEKRIRSDDRSQITLSFDHRSLDGGGAGRLLKRVVELLGAPAKL